MPRNLVEVTCGHDDRRHYAKGLCRSCYNNQNTRYWNGGASPAAKRIRRNLGKYDFDQLYNMVEATLLVHRACSPEYCLTIRKLTELTEEVNNEH